MMNTSADDSPARAATGRKQNFATTQWSVVQAAGADTPDRKQALEDLCITYWYPLYAFARHRGHSANDAQDLTQGFIATLLERQTIGRADPQHGRFRSFLLASFRYFISDHQRSMNAQKRGGGRVPVSIDSQNAEERYQWEPADNLTPEAIFERRWALTVLETTMDRLRTEYSSDQKRELFDALRDHLGADKATEPQKDIAIRLGMTETALKVAAHRMRKRYRLILRSEIAQTVSSEGDLDDELQQLFLALAGN